MVGGWYGMVFINNQRAPLWKGEIPIPIKLIINQVAQTIPGDEGPIEMQKNRKIGVEKQTATKERVKEKNR